jgi:hypothetical protein
MFMGARIEEHQPAGTKTFDLTNVMLAKPAPLIQPASVCKDVSPTCSVDMEVNCPRKSDIVCEEGEFAAQPAAL